MQIKAPRDFGDLLPPLDRHPPGRRVLRFGCQTQDLCAMAQASGLKRLGHDAMGVDLDGHNLGPRGAGGIAKAGIGQFFDQDHGPVTPQAAIEDQRNRVLAAMGQCHVSGSDRPQNPVAHPDGDLGTQGRFALLAGVVKPPLPRCRRHVQKGRPKRLGLADLGHLRRAQVHNAGQATRRPF